MDSSITNDMCSNRYKRAKGVYSALLCELDKCINYTSGDRGLTVDKDFLGMIVGAVFYLISVFTKESVGKGDSIVIFTLGCIAGAEKLLLILLWAFILCTVVSLIGIALRKLSLKARVPFIPFVLAGEIVTLII